MAEPRKFSNVSLGIEHEPESHPSEGDLPGFLNIVAYVDGAKVIIARRKAAGVFADIERAREQQQQPQE